MPYDTISPQRRAYYDKLEPTHTAPLWEVLERLLTPEPTTQAQVHRWDYQQLRPLLLESGDLLTAEEAERRVLVLENPSFPGESRTTSTLYAGPQLILPGETAPAHRHSPSALRLLAEGEYGFTTVDGERTTMHEGDFVITPSWAWHDHGNDGDGPVIWLDGLDIPSLQYFESIFSEHYNDSRQALGRPEGDSMARFGSGLLPMEARSPYGATSPIFNYPYQRTRQALVQAAAGAKPDPNLGTTLRYANPIDGGWAMPTMATWMTHLQAGQSTLPLRSTDSLIIHVVEGKGEITLNDTRIAFGPKDVIAVPVWHWRSFRASSDCFFFCFSDRVVHEKLGFYREQRHSL